MENKSIIADEVFKYFKDKLDNYNLVLKYFKEYWYSFLGIGLLSVILITIRTLFGITNYFLLTGATVLSVFGYIVLLYIINKKAKNTVESKYNIEQNECFWGGTEFRKMKVNKLKKKMFEMNSSIFKEPKKIDLLIEIINEDAKKYRVSSEFSELFLPGLALGFIIPIWTNIVKHYFDILFELVNVENLASHTGEILKLFVILCFGLSVIFFIIGMIKKMSKDILDRDYKKRKKLVNMLKQIKLNINISSN